MQEQAQEIIDMIIETATVYGLQVIGAIIILIIGWTIAGWAKSAVDKGLAKTGKVDEMLRGFISSLAKYIVLILTLLSVLAQFGVETTSFIAVLGAAGLAIGLALQGTLSNVAAGVMILLLRPFKVGHFIEAGGNAGTVRAVGLFTTELSTGDNVHIVVPNSQIWGSSIRNFSHHSTRRIDLLIGISYEDNIDQAIAAVGSVVEADARVLKDPAPVYAVGELADSSVNLVVRLWCNSGDYWALRWDTIKAIKERFDKDGISIPYPQRTVHMVAPSKDA